MFLLWRYHVNKISAFLKKKTQVTTINFGSALFNYIIGWSEQTLKYNLNTFKAHTDGLEGSNTTKPYRELEGGPNSRVGIDWDGP